MCSKYVCVYIYIFMYICIYIYIYISIYTYRCMFFISVYLCLFVVSMYNTHTQYVYIFHQCIFIFVGRIHHTHSHVLSYAYTHTCTHAHMIFIDHSNVQQLQGAPDQQWTANCRYTPLLQQARLLRPLSRTPLQL